MTDADVWERLWRRADAAALLDHIKNSGGRFDDEIKFFRSHGVRTVCDAACGAGACTLALLSNGFTVRSFDVSETAAALAEDNLKNLGFAPEIKAADVLDTGYSDGEFDGVFACSVLDHMTLSDAKAALCELCRIVRPGGLILLSFDKKDDDDLKDEHGILPDGSILYTGSSEKRGMILRPYREKDITDLTAGRKTVFRSVNRHGEITVIIQKD